MFSVYVKNDRVFRGSVLFTDLVSQHIFKLSSFTFNYYPLDTVIVVVRICSMQDTMQGKHYSVLIVVMYESASSKTITLTLQYF